jgi:hypothetical protein
MPGVFGSSTLPMSMGRVNNALRNQAPGSVTVTLRGSLAGYYGFGGTVSLFGSFNGRSYPFNY